MTEMATDIDRIGELVAHVARLHLANITGDELEDLFGVGASRAALPYGTARAQWRDSAVWIMRYVFDLEEAAAAALVELVSFIDR